MSQEDPLGEGGGKGYNGMSLEDPLGEGGGKGYKGMKTYRLSTLSRRLIVKSPGAVERRT